jgi:hypothetical protein
MFHYMLELGTKLSYFLRIILLKLQLCINEFFVFKV